MLSSICLDARSLGQIDTRRRLPAVILAAASAELADLVGLAVSRAGICFPAARLAGNVGIKEGLVVLKGLGDVVPECRGQFGLGVCEGRRDDRPIRFFGRVEFGPDGGGLERRIGHVRNVCGVVEDGKGVRVDGVDSE